MSSVVLITAGDSPADALAATALSDATGQSRGTVASPSAAADPLFDPIGGFSRVNTDYAPILVTASARRAEQGRLASQPESQYKTCGRWMQSSLPGDNVGGPSAVPADSGRRVTVSWCRQVFRIGGETGTPLRPLPPLALGTQEPVPAGLESCHDSILSWTVTPSDGLLCQFCC